MKLSIPTFKSFFLILFIFLYPINVWSEKINNIDEADETYQKIVNMINSNKDIDYFKLRDLVFNIYSLNTDASTKRMIDLIDKYFGEGDKEYLIQKISERNIRAVPFLKTKLKEYKDCEYGKNIYIDMILELLAAIDAGEILWVELPDYLSKLEKERSLLFSIQMDIEKYYVKYNKYPRSLLDKNMEIAPPLYDIILKDVWGNDHFYILKDNKYQLLSAGPDGKLWTKDDIKPPFDLNKHLTCESLGK